MKRRAVQIKETLETLYEKYNRYELIAPDPLQFVYRYESKGDMEIAGFLASALAYGRVGQIEKSLTKLFGRMGQSPYEFVRQFDPAASDKLGDFKHRFTSADDISDLLVLLQAVLKRSGSIEKFFGDGYDERHENIIPALTTFCRTLRSMHSSGHDGQLGRGLKYLLVSPDGKSACKRLNLFLRWMVRADDVDAGLWKSIDRSKLIVPIDTHMARLCRILGFYDEKTVSLKTAVKITKGFARIEPSDPVKYDFALSRIGIVENCTGKKGKQCTACELLRFCSRSNG